MRKVMLVYCDDPSHTAVPVGLIITEPDPLAFVPDDVYNGRRVLSNPIRGSWYVRAYDCKVRWAAADTDGGIRLRRGGSGRTDSRGDYCRRHRATAVCADDPGPAVVIHRQPRELFPAVPGENMPADAAVSAVADGSATTSTKCSAS